MRRLCKEYDLVLKDMRDRKNQFSWYLRVYTDHSATDRKNIFLGVYENEEHRLFDFFHELGHCVNRIRGSVPKYEELPYYHFNEACAWKTGIELAKKNSITFSKSSIIRAKELLKTYFRDNHPEKTPMKYYEEALIHAFGI